MSKFNSTFFKRNNTQQINITKKVSQKELKKNKKSNSTNVSDMEFDKLMEESENVKILSKPSLNSYLTPITTPTTTTTKFANIENLNLIKQLVNEGTGGNQFIQKINLSDISGTQLLKQILDIYKPEKYNWIETDEYGDILKNLLENDYTEQLYCLMIITDYSIRNGLKKISYKDSQVYWIKFIFQLLFMQDIIDESVYWNWQELMESLYDIDDEIKNKICIQLTDFFNILKLTFTDEDYEDENGKDKEGEIQDIEKPNNKLNVKSHNLKSEMETEEEEEEEEEEDNKYIVPEEQDWNMDDNNFNIDDL